MDHMESKCIHSNVKEKHFCLQNCFRQWFSVSNCVDYLYLKIHDIYLTIAFHDNASSCLIESVILCSCVICTLHIGLYNCMFELSMCSIDTNSDMCNSVCLNIF